MHQLSCFVNHGYGMYDGLTGRQAGDRQPCPPPGSAGASPEVALDAAQTSTSSIPQHAKMHEHTQNNGWRGNQKTKQTTTEHDTFYNNRIRKINNCNITAQNTTFEWGKNKIKTILARHTWDTVYTKPCIACVPCRLSNDKERLMGWEHFGAFLCQLGWADDEWNASSTFYN